MIIRQQQLEMFVASHDFESPTVRYQLMELIVEWENMARALKRVRRNKGKPGVDGITVDQLPSYLRRHWPKIREDLLNGRYKLKFLRHLMKSMGYDSCRHVWL